MKLLMHLCCANCGLYPIKTLTERGIALRGLWFNPNIHPASEYNKRLEALTELEKAWGLDVEYEEGYGLMDFLMATEGRTAPGKRCEVCYWIRLSETARTAKKMGLDGFTTSLLVSPYQQHEMIVDTGRRLSKEYSIPFFEEDMRPGYREGVGMSREMGLYRQKYCGCIFSEMERFAKGEKKKGV